MGADFAIIIEPRATRVTASVSVDEVEALYREQLAPGMPPLNEIREHLVLAIARMRQAQTPDPIEELLREFVDNFGRERYWWTPDLVDQAKRQGVTPPDEFQIEPPAWCEASNGIRTMRVLREFVLAQPNRAEEVRWTELILKILSIAEREERRWRLAVWW